MTYFAFVAPAIGRSNNLLRQHRDILSVVPFIANRNTFYCYIVGYLSVSEDEVRTF